MSSPLPFGRYLLLKKLAIGGMAEIFLAKLQGIAGFEKLLAIKRILPHWSQNREFITMLVDEAKIVVQLAHPNIVSVYELGKEEESYYIAMEYLEGIDLRKLFRRCQSLSQKLPPPLVVFVITEVLKALSYAHRKSDVRGQRLGIIHRDISPQNILISFDGVVKVTDFGIARAAGRTHETVTGTLKGKFAYMSPEQASQQELDHRSDLFSVGILLYELATGERLFGGKGDIATLEEVRRAKVLFPGPVTDPDPLREIILKSLKKRREERFQEASEFLAALEEWGRREGKRGSADELASFLTGLFADEMEARRREDEKLMEETGRFFPETVLAPREGTPILNTVTAPTEGTHIFVSQLPAANWVKEGIAPPSPPFHRRFPWWLKDNRFIGLGAVGLGLVGLITLGFLRDDRSAKQNRFQTARPLAETTPASTTSPTVPTAVVATVAKPLPTVPSVATPPSPSLEAKPIPPPKKEELTPLASLKPPLDVKPDSLPEKSKEKTRGDDKKEVLEKKKVEKGGRLSVQAIPWGFVSIDNQAGQETPLRQKRLTAGTHTVKVYYEPEKKTLSKEVVLADGDHVRCVADFFKKKKRLECQ